MKLAPAGNFLLCLVAAMVPALANAADKAAPRVMMSAVAQSPLPAAGSNDPSTEAADRGRGVFAGNCVLCHGLSGKGDGRAAKFETPRPADLTASTATDQYKPMIISKGGASVGKSVVMPAWGNELSKAQIDDLVAYLRVLAAPRP